MKKLFWKTEENRLRFVWRFAIYALLIVGAMFLLSAVVEWAVRQTASGLPNGPLLQIVNGLITAVAMLGAAVLAARWLDRRKFSDYGFHFSRRWWFDLAFGLGLGAILMGLIFLVEWAFGWIQIEGMLVNRVPAWPWGAWILSDVVLFLCVGIYEEFFTRGYLLRNLAEAFCTRRIQPKTALLLAYLISSSIFGLLHLANNNASLISTLNLIAAGVFLGLGYVLTGELAISIGLHITWNFFQGTVFGFPVSGGASAASLIGITQQGSDWATGGAFGPEAGALGLAALLLGSLLIGLWVRTTRGGTALKTDLAVYERLTAPVVAAEVPRPEETAQPVE